MPGDFLCFRLSRNLDSAKKPFVLPLINLQKLEQVAKGHLFDTLLCCYSSNCHWMGCWPCSCKKALH